MKFSLQIKEPCHENWENMPSDEKGRFCNQCSKTVYDFTNHAPQEINEKLIRSGENICGRIPTSYLNKSFENTSAYAMAGVLALTGFSAFSQTEIKTDSLTTDTSGFHIQTDTLNNYYKFSGSVTDTGGQPIGGAIIQIKQGEKYIAQGYSLSTGMFALFIDKTKTSSDSLIISVQKDSFFVVEQTIVVSDSIEWKNDFVLTQAVITVEERACIIMEGMTLGAVYNPPITVTGYMVIREEEEVFGLLPLPVSPLEQSKDDSNTRIKRPSNKHSPRQRGNENKNIETEINAVVSGENDMMVYPNPAIDYVIIEFLQHDSYAVSIYNLQRELQLQQTFTGTSLRIDITALAAATYEIVAVDITGREFSHQLVKV